jgi:hypothetical protein
MFLRPKPTTTTITIPPLPELLATNSNKDLLPVHRLMLALALLLQVLVTNSNKDLLPADRLPATAVNKEQLRLHTDKYQRSQQPDLLPRDHTTLFRNRQQASTCLQLPSHNPATTTERLVLLLAVVGMDLPANRPDTNNSNNQHPAAAMELLLLQTARIVTGHPPSKEDRLMETVAMPSRNLPTVTCLLHLLLQPLLIRLDHRPATEVNNLLLHPITAMLQHLPSKDHLTNRISPATVTCHPHQPLLLTLILQPVLDKDLPATTELLPNNNLHRTDRRNHQLLLLTRNPATAT